MIKFMNYKQIVFANIQEQAMTISLFNGDI